MHKHGSLKRHTAPSITSSAAPSMAENLTAVQTCTATSPDGIPIVWSIVGGADQAKFSIGSSSGALAFLSAPDFETPTDSGGNNVYDVTIRASTGQMSVDQNVAVTVTNVSELTPGTVLFTGHATSPYHTYYTISGATLTKQTDFASNPLDTVWGAAFSPDGQQLLVASNNSGSPFLYDTATWTRNGSAPDSPYTNTACAWRPDGTQYAIASTFRSGANTKYIEVTNYPALTLSAESSLTLAGEGLGVAYAPNGGFMAAAHIGSPFVKRWSISGTSYTNLSNSGVTLPTGNGRGVHFSADSGKLAVAHDTSPFVTIYTISGSTFTKITNPGTLPAGNGNCVAFSPDGTMLAVGHESTPFLTVYKVSDWSKLSNPATLPAEAVKALKWNSGSSRLYCGHANSPFITVYAVASFALTKDSNPSTLPDGTVNALAINP